MIKEDKREQERRKRRRKKLKQSQLRHAKRGVISCTLSGISLISILSLLAITYRQSGAAAAYIGGLGMIALVFAIVGVYMGVKGFKERNKAYITCKVGIGVSSFLVLTFLIIFCRGLF